MNLWGVTHCWILVELLVFINFIKIKIKKNPTNVWLKCFRDFFFSEVNIFHYRTQKWNLQIYKLKTLVLNVNFGFQQTDVITSFIHFIENHFTFPSPCSFEPTVQLQSRCEQASCSSQTNCQEPPTVSTEIIFYRSVQKWQWRHRIQRHKAS